MPAVIIIIIIITIVIITYFNWVFTRLQHLHQYTHTKENKNKLYIHETTQKQGTNYTKHSKYKYTYYQNTHTLQNAHTRTHNHTLQNKLKQPKHKTHAKWNSHNTINYPQ